MSQTETRTERATFRLDGELLKKLDTITKTENKKISSVAYDACVLYAEIYPALHLLKSLKLNPSITINEEEIKKKLYEAIKKTI